MTASFGAVAVEPDAAEGGDDSEHHGAGPGGVGDAAEISAAQAEGEAETEAYGHAAQGDE